MGKNSSNKDAGRNPQKAAAKKVAGTSKLETLITLLGRPTGSTIQELAAATSWQTHSVRGAIAGTLKKKGHTITSEIVDGVRRYRIAERQS